MPIKNKTDDIINYAKNVPIKTNERDSPKISAASKFMLQIHTDKL